MGAMRRCSACVGRSGARARRPGRSTGLLELRHARFELLETRPGARKQLALQIELLAGDQLESLERMAEHRPEVALDVGCRA